MVPFIQRHLQFSVRVSPFYSYFCVIHISILSFSMWFPSKYLFLTYLMITCQTVNLYFWTCSAIGEVFERLSFILCYVITNTRCSGITQKSLDNSPKNNSEFITLGEQVDNHLVRRENFLFCKNLVVFNEARLHETILDLHMNTWIFFCLSIASVDGKQHLSDVVFSALIGNDLHHQWLWCSWNRGHCHCLWSPACLGCMDICICMYDLFCHFSNYYLLQLKAVLLLEKYTRKLFHISRQI